MLIPLLIVAVVSLWLVSPDQEPGPPDGDVNAVNLGQKPGIAVLPFDKAITDFEAGVEINPTYQHLRTWLAAAYAGAGRMDDAQWESREILTLYPQFAVSHVERAFPIRDPTYRERFLKDLRRAGLPD